MFCWTHWTKEFNAILPQLEHSKFYFVIVLNSCTKGFKKMYITFITKSIDISIILDRKPVILGRYIKSYLYKLHNLLMLVVKQFIMQPNIIMIHTCTWISM